MSPESTNKSVEKANDKSDKSMSRECSCVSNDIECVGFVVTGHDMTVEAFSINRLLYNICEQWCGRLH